MTSLLKNLMGTSLFLFLIVPAVGNAQVPEYAAEYMGPGYGTMNNAGTVIGNESAWAPGIPWVNDGSGRHDLPLPDGAVAATVAAINDAGVIVGGADTNSDYIQDVPVRWTPDGAGGYTVETLPLAGASRAHAVAINNAGVVLATGLGAGSSIGYSAYVIDGDTVTPIGVSNPMDINDNGIVLTNNQLYDYPNATALAFPPLPDTMPRAIGLYPAGINDNNEVIVNLLTAVIGSTRYNAIGIYTVGVGWDLLLDVQTLYTATGINNNGDATFGHALSGCGLVYLKGLGYYCPDSLLDALSSDWNISGAVVIATDGTVLGQGGNSTTAEYGLVRMTKTGDLSVPSAPVNFIAVPHEPTWQQPFISVDLSWDPADTLSTGYVVERKGPADADFLAITGTLRTAYYRDMAIEPDTVYSYRVIATGLAGNSVPSVDVTVTTPGAPDREAPTAAFVTPQDGATVSGVVPVEVTASDNVAVQYIIVTTTGLDCRTYGQTSASCSWNTRDLAAGDYVLNALVADTLGNYVNEQVTVTVETVVAPTQPDKTKPDKTNGGTGQGKGKGNK